MISLSLIEGNHSNILEDQLSTYSHDQIFEQSAISSHPDSCFDCEEMCCCLPHYTLVCHEDSKEFPGQVIDSDPAFNLDVLFLDSNYYLEKYNSFSKLLLDV